MIVQETRIADTSGKSRETQMTVLPRKQMNVKAVRHWIPCCAAILWNGKFFRSGLASENRAGMQIPPFADLFQNL